ncbi:hypothetical protein [uncultured Croceitalea sp.]|uniref:hypothetical protein n=1 Tax=uncultured Croceitalea sp. TaxID=1798908 RepID=UPI00374F3242
MKVYVFSILGLLLFTSCDNDDSITQNDLENQLREIKAIAESEACLDINDWRLIGIGAKPCGGPSSYIAYSININTEAFLSLVESYNSNVRDYNEREGLISDCAIVSPPSSIRCENDKVVYENEASN